MAMVNPEFTDRINLNTTYTDGDRSGQVHIGYNQSFLVGKSIIILSAVYIDCQN